MRGNEGNITLKNSIIEQSGWYPTADFATLRLRAATLARLRDFFASRGILEVETPLLSEATVTDPYLSSMSSQFQPAANSAAQTLYLQTSPEYAMKRLLAAGSGPIYQIGKAFRNGDSGRFHNPEFTMLEWYRPGFNHHDLMDEMDQLLTQTIGVSTAQRFTYAEIFKQYADIDPHTISLPQLETYARQTGLRDQVAAEITDRDTWLHIFMTHIIEPDLGRDAPVFIYDFPESQAALARIRPGSPPVAERFEVYVQGMELANGYHELADAVEQQRRFTADLMRRQQAGLPVVPEDKRLLAALAHGFPDCAGVALGVDRLVMLAAKVTSIAEVITFPVDRA